MATLLLVSSFLLATPASTGLVRGSRGNRLVINVAKVMQPKSGRSLGPRASTLGGLTGTSRSFAKPVEANYPAGPAASLCSPIAPTSATPAKLIKAIVNLRLTFTSSGFSPSSLASLPGAGPAVWTVRSREKPGQESMRLTAEPQNRRQQGMRRARFLRCSGPRKGETQAAHRWPRARRGSRHSPAFSVDPCKQPTKSVLLVPLRGN